jgi:hypothetical protein
MRLSEALSPATWLTVPFAGGAVLNVKYRPSSATVAEMQKMTAGSQDEQVEQIIKTIQELVEDWDLTKDDGETKVGLDRDSLIHVPANIFRAIIMAVAKHQQSGEAESSSADG